MPFMLNKAIFSYKKVFYKNIIFIFFLIIKKNNLYVFVFEVIFEITKYWKSIMKMAFRN